MTEIAAKATRAGQTRIFITILRIDGNCLWIWISLLLSQAWKIQ
jgi:hypothetical protein